MTEENVSWEDLIGSAKKESDAYETRNDKDSEEYTPMVFLRNGSHKIRIYPDKSVPGKVRLIRKVQFHRATVSVPGKDNKPVDKSIRVRCEGGIDHCKVCKVMDEASKMGYTLSWTHFNTTGLCYGIVYESTEKSDFIKLDTPTVIALEYKMIYAFNKLISGYTGSEVKKLLDTLEESNIIEIDHKSGAGGNTMIRLDPIRKKSLPVLPQYFKPLDELFVPDKPGSDEDVKLICQAIIEKASNKAQILQPDGTEASQTKKVSDPIVSEPPRVTSVGSATFSAPVSSSGQFIGIPGIVGPRPLPEGTKLPENSPMCYGARPEAGHPLCRPCEFEPTCIKVTMAQALSVK